MLAWLRAAAAAVSKEFRVIITGLGLLMLVLGLAGGAVAVHYHDAARAAQSASQSAEQHVRAVRDSVIFEATLTRAAEARGDSLVAVAGRAARAALADSAQLVLLRAKFVQLANAAPSCATVAQSAHDALAESDTLAASLGTKADADSAAAATYKLGLDSAQAANANLLRAVASADSARATVPTEPFLSRIRPRLGFAFFAGATFGGKPTAGLGFTYGWRF